MVIIRASVMCGMDLKGLLPASRAHKIAAMVIAASMLLAIYMIAIEPFSLRVVEGRASLFDDGAPPLRIVVISDTHIPFYPQGYLDSLIERINGLEPDYVFIVGDIMEGQDQGWDELAKLRRIRSRYGTFAVLGNHDYIDWVCGSRSGLAYADRVESVLEAQGISVLRNENRELDAGGRRLILAGLDDGWACMADYDSTVAGADPSVPWIILAHEQEYVPPDGDGPSRLVLSGHTHCGQVRLPIIGSIPKLAGFPGDVEGGWGRLDDRTQLYVGCGATPGGIRLGAPPEITLILLS